MPNQKLVVVTGAAGFIGMHLVEDLLTKGYSVLGIDNFLPAYQGHHCQLRAEYLARKYGFRISNLELASSDIVQVLASHLTSAHSIIHLAAWPGVRQGQINPLGYSKANLIAFTNVLEAVRISRPRQFMFASSSSIYGNLGLSGPVREVDADGSNLRSYYASTKWANEILARQYFSISEIPTIALRFFTVYGEFGRPDMAYWTFLDKMMSGSEIDLFGNSGGSRNFTYVKDCVKAITRLVEVNIKEYLPVNIALDEPVETAVMLDALARHAQKTPRIRIVERPLVDVDATWANRSQLESLIGKLKLTSLDEGISRFVGWFQNQRST